MFRTWKTLGKTFVVIISFILIALFGIYIFSFFRVTGDGASHLLLATSPILKIGAPYTNFWDIKPPMMPLTLFVWSKLFGFGIISIRAINILLPILSVVLTYFIYRKIFKTPVFEIVFLSTVLILLSPFLHSIMLPTEILGLTFSLLALYILVASKNSFNKYFFPGLLFFFASQSKEPFTFTAISALPILVYSFFIEGFKKFTRNALIFSSGITIGLISIFAYLSFLGSVSSYKEVFAYKSSIYKFTYENLSNNFGPGITAAERTFTEFPLGILILFIISFVSVILSNKYKKIFIYDKSSIGIKSFNLLNEKLSVNLSIIFYAVGSFIGFGLGNTFGSHYLIQVVVPLYIVFGFFISYLFSNTTYLFNKSKKHFWVALVVFLFSIIIILPKRQYLKSFLPKKTEIVMTDKVYDSEKRISDITTKDQCILSVYGWGVGENYLYSNRRPCTRYFLPSIAIKDWQKEEYRKSILENPPAAIIYQTNGSDIDVKKFESEVINISKIVKNCYKPDSEINTVFVPAVKNLANCIEDNSN